MKHISRRDFIKALGGSAVAATAALTGCKNKANDTDIDDNYSNQQEPPKDKMTYRTTPTTHDKISLLGCSMMRLPKKEKDGKRGAKNNDIDQEQLNRLVDYALEHGVNFFSTSPAFSKGVSERATGIALSSHPRNKYFIATELSNTVADEMTKEVAIDMLNNSLKELQTEYIDYYMLDIVGNDDLDDFTESYIDSGVLDYLMEQRKEGSIRNLGWSFNGDIEVFDWLLENNDKYHWDFAQIQANYVDWNPNSASEGDENNCAYLYGKLENAGIPVIIYEPLQGKRLEKLPKPIVRKLKEREPQRTATSWAFRFCGTLPNILTVLGGMNYLEQLKDNILSFSPLQPLTDTDSDFLLKVAEDIRNVKTISCDGCKRCMPCPYGIDIPSIFAHYNLCVNEGTMPSNENDSEYSRLRRQYLIGLVRKVPRERQPDHCIGCGECAIKCPHKIDIPEELHLIDQFIENLKRGQEQ